MKIFLKDQKLEALFRAGQAPEPEMMLGPDDQPAEWRVDMLTGLIPNMGGRRFRHRKTFARIMIPEEVFVGRNVLFADHRWGWFKLERAVNFDGMARHGLPVLLINYDVPENGWLTKRICDHLRTTEDPDVMIGKFHWVWRRRPRFLGYFTLTRIKSK